MLEPVAEAGCLANACACGHWHTLLKEKHLNLPGCKTLERQCLSNRKVEGSKKGKNKKKKPESIYKSKIDDDADVPEDMKRLDDESEDEDDDSE